MSAACLVCRAEPIIPKNLAIIVFQISTSPTNTKLNTWGIVQLRKGRGFWSEVGVVLRARLRAGPYEPPFVKS